MAVYWAAALALASWALPVVLTAQAAPLQVLTTRSIRTVLDRVGPEFERASGRSLLVTTDVAAPMVRRVRNGEPFDVLVAAPEQMDALVTDGFIAFDTRVDLARSGIGIAVCEGAAVPDVSSVDAFRRTLLNAKSIAYLKEGQSGVYLARLLQDLSVAAAIEPKVVRPDRDIVSEMVAGGAVELGMVVITQIMTTPGVRLAGPLPDEIQRYIVFAGGVGTRSQAPKAARDLLAFLGSPSAHAVMREQGIQPCPKPGVEPCARARADRLQAGVLDLLVAETGRLRP